MDKSEIVQRILQSDLPPEALAAIEAILIVHTKNFHDKAISVEPKPSEGADKEHIALVELDAFLRGHAGYEVFEEKMRSYITASEKPDHWDVIKFLSYNVLPAIEPFLPDGFVEYEEGQKPAPEENRINEIIKAYNIKLIGTECVGKKVHDLLKDHDMIVRPYGKDPWPSYDENHSSGSISMVGRIWRYGVQSTKEGKTVFKKAIVKSGNWSSG